MYSFHQVYQESTLSHTTTNSNKPRPERDIHSCQRNPGCLECASLLIYYVRISGFDFASHLLLTNLGPINVVSLGATSFTHVFFFTKSRHFFPEKLAESNTQLAKRELLIPAGPTLPCHQWIHIKPLA